MDAPEGLYHWDRVVPEVLAVLALDGKTLDDFQGPFAVEFTADAMHVLDGAGERIAEVPLYRLHAPDLELAEALGHELAAEMGYEGSHITITIDAGDFVVVEADGVPITVVHRSAVVEGWPLDDDQPSGT